jgi:hypothetical protein
LRCGYCCGCLGFGTVAAFTTRVVKRSSICCSRSRDHAPSSSSPGTGAASRLWFRFARGIAQSTRLPKHMPFHGFAQRVERCHFARGGHEGGAISIGISLSPFKGLFRFFR